MKNLHINPASRVFVCDDTPYRLQFFEQALRDVALLKLSNNAQEGLRVVREMAFDYYFLDYDLGGGSTTTDIALSLASLPKTRRRHVVIHSASCVGRQALKAILPSARIAEIGTFRIVLSRKNSRPAKGQRD